MKVEKWPVIKSENITIGNSDNNVAIATLWTRRDGLLGALDSKDYAIIGQLYSKYGVSLMLRNLAANPNIRHLVVVGTELASGSGENLMALWQKGVDDKNQVVGIDKSIIQKEIPREAIDLLRQNISIHDLRAVKPMDIVGEVTRLLGTLPVLPAWGEPIIFDEASTPSVDRYPSERGGAHVLRGKTIGQVWLKILRDVTMYGNTDITNYGNKATDLADLVAVVTSEDPNNPKIESFFPFDLEQMQGYKNEFLSPECPPNLSYTYGERIHAFPGKGGLIDQREIIIRKLTEDLNDRGAIAVLYEPYHDNQLDREVYLKKGFNNPCIVFLQSSVVDNALQLSAYFRSNDMFGAWPRNAFGLRFLQDEIATRLGLPLGSLKTISNRAHIYEHDSEEAKRILAENPIRYEFEEDPRGNYRIIVDSETGKIKVEHQDGDGTPLGSIEWDGRRRGASIGLGNQLALGGGFSSHHHSIYIGEELMMAEVASKLELPFRQDHEDTLLALAKIAEKAREYDRLKAEGLI